MNKTILKKYIDEQNQHISAVDNLVLLLTDCGMTEDQSSFIEAIWYHLEILKVAGKKFEEMLSNDLPEGSDPKTPENNHSVLVVDDDKVTQIMMRNILEKAGYNVSTTSSGIKGLQLAQEGNFDVIILDCQIPDLDGFEITKKIRASEQNTNKHQVIAALTSHGVTGYKQYCLSVGMDDYWKKPIVKAEILEKIQNLINHTSF